MEFAVSGLLWSRLPSQTCFCKCPWSRSSPVEVPGLGLVLQRSLSLIFSLLPQRSQTQVCPDLQRTWLTPTSSEVTDSHHDLQRFLVHAYSLRGPRSKPRPADILVQAYSLRGPRLMPRPTEVLVLIYSLENLRLMPISAAFYSSGLLVQQLLSYTCSCGVHRLKSPMA